MDNINNKYLNTKTASYWTLGTIPGGGVGGAQPAGNYEQDLNAIAESYSIDNEVFLENHYLNEQVALDPMSDVSSSTSSLVNSSYVSHTSKTTPEFSDPTKYRETILPTNYSMQNQQSLQNPSNRPIYYKNGLHGSGSSLPIDQLKLLSLKSMSSSQASKSPSPEFYSNVYNENTEERTINPRELFTSNKIPMSLSSPSLSTLFKNENQSNYNNYTTEKFHKEKPKVCPLQEGVEKVPEQQNIITPDFDFKMNNECFNAISYWLNNTLQTVDNDDENIDNTAAEIMANPTGIIKSTFYYKRRNSVQSSNPSSYIKVNEEVRPSLPSSIAMYNQKKKRRKSCNNNESPVLASELKFANRPLTGRSLTTKIKSDPAELPPLTGVTFQPKAGQSPPKSNKTSPIPTPKLGQKDKFIDESQVDDEDTPTFPCPNCDKQFKRSEHLKRHHRSVHSNIRPFHCKYCEKKFSRSDNLAQHLKTHFKLNSNGTTTLIYGNPNTNHRKKKE